MATVTHNSADVGFISSGTSLTFVVAVAAGSNLAGSIGVSWRDSAVSADPGILSSITVNGVSATFLQMVNSGGGVTEQWYSKGLTAGDNTVIITWTGESGGDPDIVAVGGMEVMNDVDQTTPIGQMNLNNGVSTTPTVNVAGCTTGSMVVDNEINTETNTVITCTVGPNQTQRWNLRVGSAGTGRTRGAASTEPVPSAGTITMSWTLSASRAWAICATEFLATSTPPAPTVHLGGYTSYDINRFDVSDPVNEPLPEVAHAVARGDLRHIQRST